MRRGLGPWYRCGGACAAALAVALCVLAAPSAQGAVFGSDDRRELGAGQRRLEASVGTLSSDRAQTICTAFCVGDAVIATASHCLFKTADELPPRLRDFEFTLGRKGERTVARIAGTEQGSAPQHIAAGSLRLSVRPPIDATSDWALVRLATPVCRAAALPVRSATPDDVAREADAGRLYQIGFHRDFGNWRLIVSGRCGSSRNYEGAPWSSIARDFSGAEHLLLHTCDTGGASSGSPLLVDGPAGPEVVGINVGTYVQSRITIENGHVTHRSRSENVANTGVATAAFAALIRPFEAAAIIPSGPDMRRLQLRLQALGFYRGTLDAGYGLVLRNAIQDYERAQGEQVTGIASRHLLNRLATGETGPARPLPQRRIDLTARQALGRGAR